MPVAPGLVLQVLETRRQAEYAASCASLALTPLPKKIPPSWLTEAATNDCADTAAGNASDNQSPAPAKRRNIFLTPARLRAAASPARSHYLGKTVMEDKPLQRPGLAVLMSGTSKLGPSRQRGLPSLSFRHNLQA